MPADEPHDVLAAEAFAVPAAPRRSGAAIEPTRRGGAARRLMLWAALGAFAAFVVMRALRRR